jgi:hypothetical protein
MQLLQINPTKDNTIHSLFKKQFRAIKSSDDKPKYYVTQKTISYIHWLVTDSVTCLPSDTCNQLALRNEIMTLEVLEAQPEEPAVFRQKLFNTLPHYYEEIQSISCAGGRLKPKHFKHTMLDDEVVAGGGESRRRAAAPAAAAEDAAGNMPVPPPPPPPAAAVVNIPA